MIWERVQYSCLSEKALISAKALVDRRIDVGLEFGFIRLFFLGGLQIIRIKLNHYGVHICARGRAGVHAGARAFRARIRDV